MAPSASVSRASNNATGFGKSGPSVTAEAYQPAGPSPSFPAVWMLAVHRDAERAMQLLLVHEVGRFWQFQKPADRLRGCAVEMRDGQEFGPGRRVVQAAEGRLEFMGRI